MNFRKKAAQTGAYNNYFVEDSKNFSHAAVKNKKEARRQPLNLGT